LHHPATSPATNSPATIRPLATNTLPTLRQLAG
jgi:hypothetical protein